MADKGQSSSDKRSLQDIRKSAQDTLTALGQDTSLPKEFQTALDDLQAYHDALEAREKSMQGALASLVDDMSQTSQTLTETGTRLEAILEAVTDVAFVVTGCESGKILDFSAGAEHIFGYTKTEALDKHLDMVVPHDETFPRDIMNGCAAGQDANNRMLMQRKSGDLFPALFSFYPLKNSAGVTQASLMIAIDNSQRELAERYLRETQEKYKALALSTPVSIIAFNHEGTIEFVNDWHLQMLDKGRKQPEFYLGRNIQDLQGVVRAGIGNKIKPVLNGQQVSLEDIHIPPSGGREEAWMNIRCAPLMVNNEMIGGILISEDITSRKRTERDLKLILDSSPIPLLKVELTDAGRIIRYLNPEAIAMFGRDAMGKVEDAYIVRADEVAKGLPGLHGDPCALHTQNGLREGIRTSHGLSGQFEVHAVMDVSVLVKAKDAAEDASRAKSDFLANISHEIRTPLNVLLGMLQLFKDEDLGEEINEMTEHATGAAYSLLGLLNDILDFSIVEARALALDEQDFNLVEIIELVATPYRVEANRKGLELECQLDAAIPARIRGDARRLRQVVFHMVGNAVKFSDQGKISLEVTFLPQPDGKTGRLVFMVSDTGIGIRQNQFHQIFEPFRQADGSRTRRHGGTGIGLSLVHEFISAMGGFIEIFSEPGEGTEFLFSIDVGIA